MCRRKVGKRGEVRLLGSEPVMRAVSLTIFFSIGSAAVLMLATSAMAEPPRIEKDGTIHVPAFDLPESSFLSGETRTALRRIRELSNTWAASFETCPPMEGADRIDIPEIRKCQADAFYEMPFYKSIRDRYDVSVNPQPIGGVYTEVFTPMGAVAPNNKSRVLVNVHGGGFTAGSRINSHLESIPIASVGKIKVISIDYRMAPEYTFPAASEDVAAVYRELLKTYQAKNIGVYGCSAGGALTAQSIAWLQQRKLPLPGAIGMFCYGADSALDSEKVRWVRSEGAYVNGAILGRDYEKMEALNSYYNGVDRKTPLASPGDYDEIMAKFPPSLLISGTRDFILSSVLVTHAQLVRLGVKADLHVWEGMPHTFLFFPELPESREAYDVIVRFFDTHLGK